MTRTVKTATGAYRRLDDRHVLLLAVELGSVAKAARRLGITEMAVRHRLHRLYQERGIDNGGGHLTAARAVWMMRTELENLEPLF